MSSFSWFSNYSEIERSFSNLEFHFRSSLNDQSDSKISLFKASCGLGKSTAVQGFLRGWKEEAFKPGNGVIISLNKLEEITDYIARAELNSSDYAVYVSDATLAARGRGMGDAGNAPVLYTTHEMFKRRVTMPKAGVAGSFANASEFHYRGKPRSLLIHDETLHRAQELCVCYDVIATLPHAMRSIDPVATGAIERLLPERGELDHHASVHVPIELGHALIKLRSRLELRVGKDALDTVEKLISASGSDLTVRGDGKGAWYLVGCCYPLPADMPHTIVLDASVGIRASYDQWARHDSRVQFLPAATADYRQLLIEWWDRGGSKSTLGKIAARMQILDAIAAEINLRPDEQWLIIHPMDRQGIDGFAIPTELKALLSKPVNARFLHWGLHLSTNEFRDVPNVVLIGENAYREQDYDAHHIAATGHGFVAKEGRQGTRIGEFGHHVSQAICRARVRQVYNGIAQPTRAYVITTRAEDKEAILRKALPGCRIQEWHPIERKPPTKAERLVLELRRAFSDQSISEVAVRELAIICGGSDGKFLTKVWNDNDVQKAMSELKLVKMQRHVERLLGADI